MRLEREFKQPSSVKAAPAMQIISLAKIKILIIYFLVARGGLPCCVS